MLTLILLVVLGGGAGLLAVWLIDARGLSGLVDRTGWRSLRRPRKRDTAPAATRKRPDLATGPRVATLPEPAPRPTPDDPGPADPPASSRVYEPVHSTFEPLPVRSAARRGAVRVPAAYTAVEGAYRDVARAPVWRKVLSLVSLLGILLVVSVTIAALAGATFGAVAELVDGAIG